MKRRWLITLGVLSFLLTFIGCAPAAVLWQWFAPDGRSVELTGLEGSLAHGRVQTVSQGPRTLAGPLEWRLQPLWLLMLHVGATVDSEGAIAGDGRIRVSPFGTLTASDVALAGALPELLKNSGYGYLPVEGGFTLDLDTLKLAGRKPEAIDGRLQLSNIEWRLGSNPLALGSFEAVLETRGQAQHAQLASLDGPLELSGEATLDAEGAYDVHLQMKTRPGAQSQIQNLLRGLGRPDTQGYYHFRTRGTL